MLSMIAVFLLGYVVLTTVTYFASSVYSSDSGSCLILYYQCGGTYLPEHSWSTHFIEAGLLAILAASIWIIWYLVREFLRPLRTAADAVRRVGPQNLGQRVALRGGARDELKGLTDALDEALDRIAAGYESQRRFAANASHELRTPLAVQRLLTEVAMDDPAAGEDLRRLGQTLLRTNERNERLIEGLLVLAESDRGLVGKAPVRLDRLVAAELDAHAELAARNDVELRRNLAESIVLGDAILLERLVRNLVSNAITYNTPGGWVEVKVDASPVITVSNTGQNVRAEEVSSLFEPFRRLNGDRIDHSGGSGLGLAIVRSIATAHNATVHAAPRPGGGLIVRISLPSPPVGQG